MREPTSFTGGKRFCVSEGSQTVSASSSGEGRLEAR
jgi:hypothetical protein